MLPKLYIVPRYIAPLKYFEKLVPYLNDRYEVSFLLLEDKGMRAYCEARGLAVETVLLTKKKGRIPFVSHILQYRRFLADAEALFSRERPAVILTETSLTGGMRALFARARRAGARVCALQWGQQSKDTRAVRLSARMRLRKMRARHGSLWHGFLKESYDAMLGTIFLVADFAGRRGAGEVPAVDALGVVDGYGRDFFVEEGWDPAIIRTVGYADWSLLSPRRANHPPRSVLVLSTIFYAGHATLCMSTDEQVRYYMDICDDVWAVFPDAEISFKLHPRDENIYGEMERKGVRLFGNETLLEDLVREADLYIANPFTGANFSILATGIPALFVNFTRLEFLDKGKEYYGLTDVISSRGAFRDALGRLKDGTLPLQYDSGHADPDSLRKIIAFITGA